MLEPIELRDSTPLLGLEDYNSDSLGDEWFDLLNQADSMKALGTDTSYNFLPSFEVADSQSDMLLGAADSATAVATIAPQGINQRFWTLSTYAKATVNGRYGCAAAVSEKLQMAGVPISDAATVSQVDVSLRERGWSVETYLLPGCVAFAHTPGSGWRRGGGNAHVGIVDKHGRICNNESKGGGLWKCEPLSEAFRPKLSQRYLLCPPGSQ